MLEHLFNCIKQRILTKCPEIKDVRVYNGQDVFSDEHVPFQSPTVFIDFTNVDYDTIGYQYQEAVVELRSMLFHEAMTLNHLEVFSLNSKLNSYLNVWGEWGATLERDSEDTDTNFDRLYVMNTNYITTFQESTVPDDGSKIPIGEWPEDSGITGLTDWHYSVTGLSANDQIAFEFDLADVEGKDYYSYEVDTSASKQSFFSTTNDKSTVLWGNGKVSIFNEPVETTIYNYSPEFGDRATVKVYTDLSSPSLNYSDYKLTSFDASGNSFTNLILDNNQLPTDAVERVLTNLDNTGLLNGTVSMTGGTNGELFDDTTKLSLEAKGWNVRVNETIVYDAVDFVVDKDTTNFSFNFALASPITTYSIDWGDGIDEDVVIPSAPFVTASHTYTPTATDKSARLYNINNSELNVFFDLTPSGNGFTQINIAPDAVNLQDITAKEQMNESRTDFTLTSVTTHSEWVNLNKIDLGHNHNLSTIKVHREWGTASASPLQIFLSNCALQAAELNDILNECDLGGKTNGTLFLFNSIDIIGTGTNGIPDSTSGGIDGITAMNNLINKGWNVQVNS